MINKEELTKELVEEIIDNELFYDIKFFCPDCHHIEDEQYTCTTCWGQGGDTKYKATNIIKSAFELKYTQKSDNFSKEDIDNILEYNDTDSCKWVFYDDYKCLSKCNEDDEEYYESYRTLSLNTLFHFLIKGQ